MKRQQGTAQVVALVAISMFVLALPALAQDCPELVGRLPYGAVRTVAVSGDFAYFAGGDTLMVADIVSDPSAPRVVGYVALPETANEIAVSGEYAYVAAGEAGLRVVNVSDPSAPVEVGFVNTPGEAFEVAVAGGYAYVADGDAGLRVIDVSTPSAPVEVGFLARRGWYSVAVDGDYAYVTGDTMALIVVDVSTPSAPVEVASTNAPYFPSVVAVSGGYAYVGGSHYLQVIDVSAPTDPVTVGFLETPGGVDAVAISGRYAYVARGRWFPPEGGLGVIDVSVPSAPAEVGSISTPDLATDVSVVGGHAYLAAWGSGLRVVDVSTPSTPADIGFVPGPGYTLDVAVSGSYAYAVWTNYFSGWSGLRVIDVSTPSPQPVEVGFVETQLPSLDVAVSGSYAYLTLNNFPFGGEGGLVVIDVSTPSAPVEMGFVDTPGSASTVAVSGGYAYVAWRNEGMPPEGGLRIIDVSAPSAPVEVGFIDTPARARDVAVSGGYAFVASTEGDWNRAALRIIDVSAPSEPVEVGFIERPGSARGVAVSGRYAYVASSQAGPSWGGLWIIDVSTPSAPVEVGFVGIPDSAIGVAVSGRYAYVADGDAGLRVIDVSTPSAPVEVGSVAMPSLAHGVEVSGGYVLVAADDAGLLILSDCAPRPDARECFIPAAAVAAGAQGAFFSTDLEINNRGREEAQVSFRWLPRGEDNSEPMQSDPIALASGESLRYENVLTELFGLEPDALGALKLVASTESVIGMSRTYNSPEGKAAGTFGQGLPAIRATDMITGRVPQRIIFLSEDFVSRSNLGCINGSSEPVTINIELFNSEGESLEVKTMELGPYSNDQINQVFQGHLLGDGYVDVWADDLDALYTCYGSMLDNETSDPTTILPQVPSADMTFISAAALAAGLQGSFFQTDLELNNAGSTNITYELLWLPRGADNSDPVSSDTFSLAPGAGVRYANVLDEVFGLEPDAVGALALEASGADLLVMSRTYNLPSAEVAGTFGQELPGIPADRMIASGVKKRIIFMNENDDVRANVGCQNGSPQTVRVFVELFNSEGESLEVKTMDLAPLSNNQINRVFRDYAPIEAGYVDVWTSTPGATIYCYGSVLDNTTSDPTTIPPM